MNVASLDLCKELYELSGWNNLAPGVFDIEKAWRPTPLASADNYRLIGIGPNTQEDIPAYDLDYLLTKLPKVLLTNDYDSYAAWRAGPGRTHLRAKAGGSP